MNETLRKWLPGDEHKFQSHLSGFLDEEVVKEYVLGAPDWKKWPGSHKNVMNWVELSNGKAVGWNENQSTGWSFPVHNLYKRAEHECTDCECNHA